MPRGIRADTPTRIKEARVKNAFSIGPILGEFAIMANLSASTVARVCGTYEQTVFRWYFGYSEPNVVALPKIVEILTVLAWAKSHNRLPLIGSVQARESAFSKLQEEIYAKIVGGDDGGSPVAVEELQASAVH